MQEKNIARLKKTAAQRLTNMSWDVELVSEFRSEPYGVILIREGNKEIVLVHSEKAISC